MLREKEKLTGTHQFIVAMTALVMKNDRERCLAAGMDGYLPKPIRPQELDEVLDARMENEAARPKLDLKRPAPASTQSTWPNFWSVLTAISPFLPS